MLNTVPAEQKETAREYLRRAFSARTGYWFTMEEIKGEVSTGHGIRALCTRGDEAIHDGELINRFRAGKNYKEWTWLGHYKPENFFFKLQDQFSPLYTNYCDLDALVKKLLYKPQDSITIYYGTYENPIVMSTVRLSPLDLVNREYAICSNCHGTCTDIYKNPCIFCAGTGWLKKAEA